jgi:HEPN domain-containing protein
MKSERLILAEEWFTKGSHDIEMAQLLYNERGYTETIAFLIQQAVEKYLKGYLIYNGWRLRKIHDLEALLSEAIRIEKDFSKFLGSCQKITQYYIESRYPLESPIEYPREEIKQSLDEAYEIIAKIKQAVKQG